MKSKLKALTGVLITVAVVAVASGCGSSDRSSSTGGSSSAGNATDRAFIAAMVPHHRSAIEMASIANTTRTRSAYVANLAGDIVRTQGAEITQMQTIDKRLAADGIQQGELGISEEQMGMHSDPSSLRTAKPFDPAFLNMMLTHHEGAVTMAKIELSKGSDPALKRLAKNIITAQTREIAGMKAHGASAMAGHM